MKAHIKLGRIFGIEIGLHYSWLLIALLITLSLAGQFSGVNPQWGTGVVWATAIMTGLLFFTAILLHELSHAAVARLRGLPVRSITLFALGGIAQIEKEAADAKTEFWMGIVGPITSALIGLACLGLGWLLGWTPAVSMTSPQTPLLAMLVWLGYINIGLAVFNMIPGFPMDGGRVLRAAVWWMTGDAARSTRIAARAGQVVGLGLMVFGIFSFIGGAGLGGLWIFFIGMFLQQAAGASRAQSEIMDSLRGLRVRDVVSAGDCPIIDGRENLQTFVDEHLLRTGRRCFIVEEQGRISGLVTPHEIKEIPRGRWSYTTIDDVKRPLDQLRTVGPDTPITQALEVMGREDLNQLPVVRAGRLEGILSRGHILRVLQTRAELGV